MWEKSDEHFGWKTRDLIFQETNNYKPLIFCFAIHVNWDNTDIFRASLADGVIDATNLFHLSCESQVAQLVVFVSDKIRYSGNSKVVSPFWDKTLCSNTKNTEWCLSVLALLLYILEIKWDEVNFTTSLQRLKRFLPSPQLITLYSIIHEKCRHYPFSFLVNGQNGAFSVPLNKIWNHQKVWADTCNLTNMFVS